MSLDTFVTYLSGCSGQVEARTATRASCEGDAHRAEASRRAGAEREVGHGGLAGARRAGAAAAKEAAIA